ARCEAEDDRQPRREEEDEEEGQEEGREEEDDVCAPEGGRRGRGQGAGARRVARRVARPRSSTLRMSAAAAPSPATKQRIRRTAGRVRAGGVVAYPTEAVFGIGCLPDDEPALARVLAIKRRSWRKGMLI